MFVKTFYKVTIDICLTVILVINTRISNSINGDSRTLTIVGTRQITGALGGLLLLFTTL